MTSPRKRRRIDSSSELEEPPMSVASRRTRLSPVPAPASSTANRQVNSEEAEDEAVEVAGRPHPEPAEEPDHVQDEDAAAPQQQGVTNGEEEDEELQEKWRIWEDFQDEYFDIVEQLPLELQRNFQLILEHGEQARTSEKELQDSLLRYLSLARKPSYSGALAEEAYAKKIAANQGSAPHAGVTDIASTSAIPLDPQLLQQSTSSQRTESDNQRDTSISSEEAVRTALLPSTGQAVTSSRLREEHPDGEPAIVLRKLLGDITKHARMAIRASEDKVALSSTAYDWVDRHIRRLDSDLMKHEESLSLGLRAGTLPSTDAREAQAYAMENAQAQFRQDPSGTAGGGKGKGHILPIERDISMAVESENGQNTSKATSRKNNKKKKKAGGGERKKSQKAGPMVAGPVNPLPRLPPGMVADPGQPTYCFCNQISYGEMLGCDNDDCQKEWFHLACVGYTAAPKGGWYCIDCAKNLGIR